VAGGGVTDLAAKMAADVADPPSGLVTTKASGDDEDVPRVQTTLSDVADIQVVGAHVPVAVSEATAPVTKPEPVTTKVLVEAAGGVAGLTAVMVGAASRTRPAGANGMTVTVPPLVLVRT